MINLSIYLIINAVLFGLAILGILINRKNLIVLIICIELMLLAANTNFIVYSRLWNNINGQIMVFFILVGSAAEMVIGLAILIKLFKLRSSVNIIELSNLKD